jgi:hypothetical protein
MKETRRLLIEIEVASGQAELLCGSHPGKSELPCLQISAILTVHQDCIIRFTRKELIQPRLSQARHGLRCGPTKRIGRPPKNPLANAISASAPAPAKRKRRKFSRAQREAAAERMRQRWAAKRKADAKAQPKTVRKSKKMAKAA